MNFYLNERSLQGQFENIDDFLEALRPTIKCLEMIHKSSDIAVFKVRNFYSCWITKKEKLGDLKKHRCSDELMRLQISLDNEIYDAPYWDDNPAHDIARKFTWEKEDVTATAIAEAAVSDSPLLSFKNDIFEDRFLTIKDTKKTYEIQSVHTPGYLVEQYKKELKVSRKDTLLLRYQGTRIDCSLIEEKYGPNILEKKEFELLILTLDKFVKHSSWDDIEKDDGLEYKKYSPSSTKYDWFHSARYKGKTIMKFRFSDILRGYGYRKGNTFKVLRLEKNHKISDKG